MFDGISVKLKSLAFMYIYVYDGGEGWFLNGFSKRGFWVVL